MKECDTMVFTSTTVTAILVVTVTGLIGAAVMAGLCQLVRPDDPGPATAPGGGTYQTGQEPPQVAERGVTI